MKYRRPASPMVSSRSEEHTSELQSRRDLVCRLLPTPLFYARSLHDALPISSGQPGGGSGSPAEIRRPGESFGYGFGKMGGLRRRRLEVRHYDLRTRQADR